MAPPPPKQLGGEWSTRLDEDDSEGSDEDDAPPPPRPRPPVLSAKAKGKAPETAAPASATSSGPVERNEPYPWSVARQAALLKRKEAEERGHQEESPAKQARVEEEKVPRGAIERGFQIQRERAEIQKRERNLEARKENIPPQPADSSGLSDDTHIAGSPSGHVIQLRAGPSMPHLRPQIQAGPSYSSPYPQAGLQLQPPYGVLPYHDPGPGYASPYAGYMHPPAFPHQQQWVPFPSPNTPNRSSSPMTPYPMHYAQPMPGPLRHNTPPYVQPTHAPIPPHIYPPQHGYSRPALSSPLVLQPPQMPYAPRPQNMGRSSVVSVRNLIQETLHSAQVDATMRQEELSQGGSDRQSAGRGSEPPRDTHAFLNSFAYSSEPPSTPPPEPRNTRRESLPEYSSPVVLGRRGSSSSSSSRRPHIPKSGFATRKQRPPRVARAFDARSSSPGADFGPARVIPSSHPELTRPDETWTTLENRPKKSVKAISTGAFLMPDVFHKGDAVKVAKPAGDQTIGIGFKPSRKKDKDKAPETSEGKQWKVEVFAPTPGRSRTIEHVLKAVDKQTSDSGKLAKSGVSPGAPVAASAPPRTARSARGGVRIPEEAFHTRQDAPRALDAPSSETLYDSSAPLARWGNKSDPPKPPASGDAAGEVALFSMEHLSRTYPATREAISVRTPTGDPGNSSRHW